MLLLELLGILLTQRHDRAHVDFIERGQDGVFVLRLDQTLCNTSAQTRHRDALFRTITQSDRSSCNGSLRLSSNGIFLRNTATTTCTSNISRSNTLLIKDLTGSGASGTGCCGRRCSRGRSCRSWCRCGSRGGWCRSRSRSCGVDLGDDFTRDDGITITLDQLDDHTTVRCWQFQHHFVSFDIDEVLIAGNGFAFFLVPGNQGGLGDRFRQLRDFDVDNCHYSLHGLLW